MVVNQFFFNFSKTKKNEKNKFYFLVLVFITNVNHLCNTLPERQKVKKNFLKLI